MTISESPRRQPSQWLILALALFLVLIAGAVLWVLMRNAASTSSIRLEAQKELLIFDMVSAVQVEAELVGAFAGQTSSMHAMSDGDSMEGMAGRVATGDPDGEGADDMADTGMSDTDMAEQPGNGLLAQDPEILGAIASFGEAAGSLKQLVSDSERDAIENAVKVHNDFVASIAALDVQARSGQDAMSYYHGTTQVLEAALRTSLQELQSASSTRLQSAIDDATSAEILLRWAVPVLLLGGLVAAAYLLKTQATKRRIANLERLVEAKGEFIAAVSHELRTPMTAVFGFADLLRKSGAELSSSDRAQMVAAIAEQSEEVTAIVDDLLVAARTDIGELTVAAVPIDLRAQAAQILEILDPNHSIPVLGHAPTAAGDPTRVRQILRNLITNAKRYGGDNISVVLGSQSNTFASLAVKDNGDPIPANHQERIFKPYQRADDRPDQPGSIGLGLAVSRRLARLMSGDLTYLYQDGHSIFELSLPVVAEPHLEADQETAAAAR